MDNKANGAHKFTKTALGKYEWYSAFWVDDDTVLRPMCINSRTKETLMILKLIRLTTVNSTGTCKIFKYNQHLGTKSILRN